MVRRLDEVRGFSGTRGDRPGAPLHDLHGHPGARPREALRALGLGYGAVVYNHGTLGREALRSQGHVHSTPEATGVGYSELYEFWHGRGLVYMQDTATADVGDVIVVEAGPGRQGRDPAGLGPRDRQRRRRADGLRRGLRARGAAAVRAAAPASGHGSLRARRRHARDKPPLPVGAAGARAAPHEFPEHGIGRGRPALAGRAGAARVRVAARAPPAVWERLVAR